MQSTVSQLELKLEGIKHFLAQERKGMPKVDDKSVPHYQASLCMSLHGMHIVVPVVHQGGEQALALICSCKKS